jgi:UDPglucose--hexose-1-phosphate uridylyltransferase
MESVGHHEIVITRGHEDDFPDLAPPAAHEVFSAFRERHEAFAEDECTAYVSIFHNWGKSAGASVYHPHYQLIATPVVPPSISHSLEGARTYFREHKECVHCTIMQSERAHGGRVILENAGAIAFAPFASRTSYTWSIFPTDHAPSFAEATEASRRAVADALRASLRAMRTALHDPDYNFYIHTMPLRERRRYGSYHWHVEVIPKLSNIGGFELSTGIIINAVDPDQAAATIRGALTA